MYPAQVVKNTDNTPLFKSAYASASTATTELKDSRYDASETNVYTDNLDKLTAIGATVTFTAAPVNTQNEEIESE